MQNSAYSNDVNLTPDEVSQLAKLYKKCDSTLKLCDKLQKEKDGLISKQKDAISAQAERIVELEKLDSPVRNPFLMAGVGAGLGLLIGGPIVMGLGLLGGLVF